MDVDATNEAVEKAAAEFKQCAPKLRVVGAPPRRLIVKAQRTRGHFRRSAGLPEIAEPIGRIMVALACALPRARGRTPRHLCACSRESGMRADLDRLSEEA